MKKHCAPFRFRATFRVVEWKSESLFQIQISGKQTFVHTSFRATFKVVLPPVQGYPIKLQVWDKVVENRFLNVLCCQNHFQSGEAPIVFAHQIWGMVEFSECYFSLCLLRLRERVDCAFSDLCTFQTCFSVKGWGLHVLTSDQHLRFFKQEIHCTGHQTNCVFYVGPSGQTNRSVVVQASPFWFLSWKERAGSSETKQHE